ncbi:MAG TPA: DUF4142 domain-containing protein [Steroidobacteraceae bacterium]|nr:DUF4142 domain-containing protein [Steroidobacteraceae bacterium]
MNVSVVLVLLFANGPDGQTTLPRQRDTPPQQQPAQPGTPTDPLFDKQLSATDEPAFVLGAIEAARQGEIDARHAAKALHQTGLRDAATRIGRQNEATRAKLETLAQRKGWRLPANNPDRATTLQAGSEARTGADFIVQQISFHETTVAKFRSQVDGPGDADLKRTLRESLPGYQKNLELLLQLKL